MGPRPLNLCLALALGLLAAGCDAQPAADAEPPLPQAATGSFPALTGRVVDLANLLSEQEEQRLTDSLAALERSTTDQFVIVTVPSLDGRSIEQFGRALGNHWGIGQPKKDNGVLMIVAPNERKVRIEVGYGLEGSLPDPYCTRLLREVVLPRFQRGEFAPGILAGSEQIVGRLRSARTQDGKAA